MLKTRERIITAKELAQAVNTALANAQREPVIVTEDGRPAAYLISIDLFDSLVAQLEEAGVVTGISTDINNAQIRLAHRPRAEWAEQFAAAAKQEDDTLLDEELLLTKVEEELD